jgi:hypothetical protein
MDAVFVALLALFGAAAAALVLACQALHRQGTRP